MTLPHNATNPQKSLPIIGIKDIHGIFKKDTPKKDLDQTFNSRIMIFFFLAIVVAVCILYKVTLIQSEEFIEKSETNLQQEKVYYDQIVQPERGNIYDRRGNLLAGNQTVYEVGVNLKNVDNPETIAEVLSAQLGLNFKDVYDMASTPYDEETSVYYRLATSVDVETYQKILDIQNAYASQLSDAQTEGENPPSLSGLTFTAYLERNYPEQTLASNVIGFVNFLDPVTGTGHYGIEEEYNDRLAGKPERIRILLDPSSTQEIPTVEPGESFILTIDREIQSMTEETLDNAVAQYGAKTGTAIIMDPETGEILAMAQSPRRNPNTYYEKDDRFEDSDPYNRAIAASYEPGSTFKPITMSGAIDNDIVEPDTTFYDPGVYYIGGWYLKNWDEAAHGEQTMVGCLQYSLNVCLAWVAEQMGEELFYENVIKFGLDRPTNIDLGGEDYFPLDVPGGDWNLVDLGTNSYGQGISLTPIQMITALSALANDGKIMQPHVVKGSIFRGTVSETPPTVNSMPISEETADTMTEMLATSLERETKLALVEGYRVAGKTGTASVPSKNGSGGYEEHLTNTSFVGWGPVDDPKFIIYIWLEEPATGEWGSVVAAPVFSEIVQKLVILMGIPPDDVRLGTATPEAEPTDTSDGN